MDSDYYIFFSENNTVHTCSIDLVNWLLLLQLWKQTLLCQELIFSRLVISNFTFTWKEKRPVTKARPGKSTSWLSGNVRSGWDWLHFLVDSFKGKNDTQWMCSYLSQTASPGFFCAFQRRQFSPFLNILHQVQWIKTGYCWSWPPAFWHPQEAPNHLGQTSHTNIQAFLRSN